MFDPFTYMQGKDLLVIGNAVTDKEIDYSKYNCIVRMNLGIQTKPIDVWINNLVTKHMKHWEKSLTLKTSLDLMQKKMVREWIVCLKS
jgi:hypothetical protein